MKNIPRRTRFEFFRKEESQLKLESTGLKLNKQSQKQQNSSANPEIDAKTGRS